MGLGEAALGRVQPTWTRGFFRMSETALLRCGSPEVASEKQKELAARDTIQPERLIEDPGSFCWACCCHETWLSTSLTHDALSSAAAAGRSLSSETRRPTLGLGSASSGRSIAAGPSLSMLTLLLRGIAIGPRFAAKAQSFQMPSSLEAAGQISVAGPDEAKLLIPICYKTKASSC